MFKIGYNTNGFACHSLVSALEIIGDLGYDSVALTIDHHALNPWDDHFDIQLARVKKTLNAYNLATVIETGARFLLTPRIKHEPTLISEDPGGRQKRIGFIEKCLEIACELESEAVSIWSGIKANTVADDRAWEWLCRGCTKICSSAAAKGIPIAFEPEPGMFVESLSQFSRLSNDVNHPMFKLTFDAGHAFITEEDLPGAIESHKREIVNIHLEDMKKNRHRHLFFGEGEMEFGPIFQTLKNIGYSGQVNVELSRHCHNAVATASSALAFIREYL